MKLYMIRHGETNWNKARKVQGRSDIPLNDYGRYLAEETAKGLQDVRLDVAYTSPLIRAKETAEIMLRGREIPLIEDKRLEELGFGSYEGMHCGRDYDSPEAQAFDKFFTDPANYKPSGGESLEDLLFRTADFLQEIYELYDGQDKTILITTHGAALNAMLNSIRGIDDVARFWSGRVHPNCAVTIIDVENKVPEILQEGIVYYQEEVRDWKWEER